MSLRSYVGITKAMADPTRVRILKILEGGEMCACQIVAVLGLKQSTASKHLFLLRSAGLIKDRREHKWIHYSLDGKTGGPHGERVLKNLKNLLDDDPLVKKYLERAAIARRIGPAVICERGMKLPVRGGKENAFAG